MRRRRRKKYKKVVIDSVKTVSPRNPLEPREILISGTLKLILLYTAYIERLKKEYFSEEVLLKIYLSSKREELFALHFEEYLEKALSYTYKAIGPVEETVLLWILKDTLINPLVFSLMRSRFEKYLKQE